MPIPKYDLRKFSNGLDYRERRLRGKINDLSAELRVVQATKRLALAALDGFSPCGFGNPVETRTMLVDSYTLDGDVLVALRPLIAAELFAPRSWHLPVPGPRPGVETMTPTEVDAEKVVRRLVEAYADGVVTVGHANDARTEPCAKCRWPVPVVCQHGFDHDSDDQWLTLQTLCLTCPHAEMLFSRSCDVSASLDLLPSRRPHPQRRG